MDKFIVVAGNIGAGKSTLVQILSEKLGYQPFFEPVNDNPYLADFYQNMEAWSFHSQLYFLTRRLRIHKQLLEAEGSVVQDRSVYEDAEVFARNLYLQGDMSTRDYGVYQDLYQILIDLLPPPNLVVYLRATVDTLLERINTRGRGFEAGISRSYLERLNVLYEEWIASFAQCPVLIIPSDNLNLVSSSAHISQVVQLVQDRIMGKTEVNL
ncbi:MAG TPA: deoxynucleoside kinase [Anaerolineaceae bacterium]|jgi:deoxyadenosine/deoxycytidine kinase|nr:deoxynucleoside kinase [Anaerolineales bacterium]HOG58566.1 deoxynucleoside kinase [Anaerolineaceae bacterium]HOR83955.1 deoxynucleoside kinase [Anaerolineaceae bacterium]HOT26534.1 deoxynucleoside kinase [Anaerolineaceae bacterium]HPL42291.1 deoxynucleoside kinase [Anaerolineaceae bacterium]